MIYTQYQKEIREGLETLKNMHPGKKAAKLQKEIKALYLKYDKEVEPESIDYDLESEEGKNFEAFLKFQNELCHAHLMKYLTVDVS